MNPAAQTGPGTGVREEDYGPSLWRSATIATLVLSCIATGLLLIGLPIKTVLYVDYSTSLSNVPLKYELSYYGAKVMYNGNDLGGSLDDLTCGKAGTVKLAGAVHFFAFFTAIATVVVFALELYKKNKMMHGGIILLSVVNGLLFFLDILLGIVRSHATYTNCATVPIGLVRYGVGGCWGCAIGAELILFIAFCIYCASRYCKCCCYTIPITYGSQGGAVMPGQVVQGQAISQQYAPTNHVHAQPVYPPPLVDANGYPVQQQQQYPVQQQVPQQPPPQNVYGPPQQQPTGYGQQQPAPVPHQSATGKTVDDDVPAANHSQI